MKKLIITSTILLFFFGGINLVSASFVHTVTPVGTTKEETTKGISSNATSKTENSESTDNTDVKDTKTAKEKQKEEAKKSIKTQFILICISATVVIAAIGGTIYYLKKKYLV